PNRDMEILHGELQLNVPATPRGQRLPIDSFLRSLADDQQENAIGVILSGTGSDGTQGARAICGMGGITMVQEPVSAKYEGMPSSVIHAGYATHVLPADKMWNALQFCTHHFSRHEEARATAEKTSGIKRVLIQLRSITGHDFSLYKQSTIHRRIERRMFQHSIDDIEVYVRFLKENPAEVHTLFRELLINVTSFFRDPEAFTVLKTEVLPYLCKDKIEDSPFRVWVAGCSTGEEAYSIAILLREFMDETRQEFRVQIYSTDLDDEVINIARAGVYANNIAQDITPERLRRFFIKEDAGYRIKKELREMVVFAIQNVIKDPPFTKLDLLSCRNLMIYLGHELQSKLIPTFHYALNPNGILFLSPSEGIGNHTELFSVYNRKWKFYRAIQTRASTQIVINSSSLLAERCSVYTPDNIIKASAKINYADYAPKLLAQFFAPASVITDLKGDILFIHGDTGRYLRPAPGHATLNIIDMAREGLNLELRSAIHAAASDNTLTLSRELQVKTNGGFSTISLGVRPLPDTAGSCNQLLISFQDIAAPKPPRKRTIKSAEAQRIEELERDLLYLKESYQISIEEQQAVNEELKSTNEEMQSTNEELQSTNEELETSKEELQSVNEELITVNSELQAKIEQLADMQNDMKNLLDNINVGIIFLDRELVIRRFTREASRIYRLVTTDVGRSLNDIKSVVEVDDLLVAAQQVLESLIPFEREIQIGGDSWILGRIQPYRTLDNMIDGVLLTYTQISARIKAIVTQEALIVAEGIVNTVREPFVILDNELKVIFASQSFYVKFKLIPQDSINLSIYELGNQPWDSPALHELMDSVLLRDQAVEDYVLEYDFPVTGHHKLLINTRRIVSKTGALQMILLSME
ncbi:MAG: CheR family methyltransferase, partial [Methylococcales bacterium]|nr:CheR family methyltransferase [Methylococcales bacterium]